MWSASLFGRIWNECLSATKKGRPRRDVTAGAGLLLLMNPSPRIGRGAGVRAYFHSNKNGTMDAHCSFQTTGTRWPVTSAGIPLVKTSLSCAGTL
jgi:hypothetical protein